MADRFELSYIYARVCGAMSRSWAGERSAELLRLQRISDLWRTVFGDAAPALPEKALVSATELRVVRESLADFRTLAMSLREEEPFFLALRRKTEFARVKRVLLALRGHEATCPPNDDEALKEGFKSEAYPRLDAMFAGTRYAWIGQDSLADLPAAENRLDRQFYEELWESLDTVPRNRRDGLKKLLALEIELENVIWALRLARYYSMRPELIEGLLVKIEGRNLTKPALDGASKRYDRRSDWDGWKYEFLIPAGGGEGWTLDVPGFETAARRHLYRRMSLALHLNPFTYTPLYCFYKLKEIETAVLLGIVEGVHLSVPPDEMAAFAMAGGLR